MVVKPGAIGNEKSGKGLGKELRKSWLAGLCVAGNGGRGPAMLPKLQGSSCPFQVSLEPGR